MTTRRRGRAGAVLWALATLAALLPTLPARADHVILQVTREVSSVLGGDAVTLTARLPARPTSTVTVQFEALDGPANGKSEKCDIPSPTSPDTCQVAIGAGQQGTSLIRASIAGEAVDKTEARLANDRQAVLGVLDDAADCRPEDDDLLQNTCRPPGSTFNEGAIPEPDGTDVVQITWTTFTEARLDCDDSNPADGEDFAYKNLSAGRRQETYFCLLTSLSGAPISGAFIDGEKVGGELLMSTVTDGADFNDLCQTGADGRCTGTVSVPESTGVGSATICFWGEPGAGPATVTNSAYDPAGQDTDGGGCDNEVVDEPEGNDITDAVLLDIDNPRASGLDAGPEVQTAASGSRFSFAALVYDQFGGAFRGDTAVKAEFFGGSPLDQDGNTPSSPDLGCQTGDQGSCVMTTAAQIPLGTNLACVWIEPAGRESAYRPADNRMIGDNLDGSCEDEVPTDPSVDDGIPFTVTDGRDIIRFTIQSRPVIFTVKPEEKRQETTDVLKVTGVKFLESARISVLGTGVELGATHFISETQLEADLEVAVDAPPGPRDVIVTNLEDGGTTTCRGCFRVVGQGYWLVAADGGIFAFGDARFAGSTGDRPLNKPIVAMAPTPSGQGYWLVASDGGIFAFGDAPFLGSTGSLTLNKPIVGMAAHPSGRGYWLVASDGGVFTFGDAKFYGSTGRLPLSKPIEGMAASPSGRGYWLVAADGGIFSFGDAKFYGSTGNLRLNQPIVAMAATKAGKGYWLLAADGGIFAFGDAVFYGSTGALRLNRPIVGIATTPFAKGYWLVASDGGIFSFGDARFHGSTGDIRLNQPIVSFARR